MATAPLRIVQTGETRTRKTRKPNFPIAGTLKPFGVYPLWATPVLPGETLKMTETKYRALSMPIKHPLGGAWLETWLVYVSLTDIDAAMAEMFISNDMSPAAFTAASDRPRFFTKAGQIDYIKLATDRFITAYFRDENEPEPARIDGVPMAARQNWDWAQNLQFKPANLVEALLPSELPESDTLTPLEIMRMTGMSELTYEKYLTQYGVSQKAANAEVKLPEILRYTRDWTTPTNNVEATTGRPSSAWTWGATVKAEKPKRFDEPGFVIQFACVRPKMFDSSLAASMVGELWGFGDWFPVYNLTDPAAGLKVIDPDNVVFGTADGAMLTEEPLLYDHRDLLSHGEQFVNDWSGPYALPEISSRSLKDTSEYPALRGRYPSVADVNGLFTDSDEAVPSDPRMRIYYEGIASVEIVGHVVDTTK